MAGIGEGDAEKILKKYGYKVQEHLGEGAFSHAFKCIDPKGRLVAAKVCAPQDNARGSLKNEINAAKELELMEKKFEAQIKAQKDPELQEAMRKHFSGFFKYSNKPKLIKVDSTTIERSWGKPPEKVEYAIFEAELADTDAWKAFKKTYYDYIEESDMLEVVESVRSNIDYKEIRRIAKDTLKGLRNFHGEGKIHGDIKPMNILKRFDTGKGKSIYSLTDFGIMRSFNIKGKVDALAKFFDDPNKKSSRISYHNEKEYKEFLKAVSCDIRDLGEALFKIWNSYLGWEYKDYPSGGPFAARFYINSEELGYVLYPLNDKDKIFINFCKKLTRGYSNWRLIMTAAAALEDPFIKSSW